MYLQKFNKVLDYFLRKIPFLNGIITLLFFSTATLAAYLFFITTHDTSNNMIFYILSIVLISRFTTGYFWGILASFFAVVGLNYFFTFPYMEFDFLKKGYPATFVGMLSISIIISTLTANIMRQTNKAVAHKEMLQRLNDINNQLLTTEKMKDILDLTIDYIYYMINSSVIFYPEDPLTCENPTLKTIEFKDKRLFLTYHESFLAHQAYVQKIPTGIDSEYDQKTDSLYIPLISHDKVWGVLGILLPNPSHVDSETITFIHLMINQVAMAIERQNLTDEHQLLEIESEKEKMRSNLLRAVSHDLRTPLTTIIGSSITLLNYNKKLSKKEKVKLLKNIHEDANWLLHMVENLLSVTKIKQDETNINKRLEPLEEVISESVSRLKKRYPSASIHVDAPEEFLMVPMDATLIEQVILNLIENAIKHSQSESPIELLVSQDEDTIKFEIYDYGIGLDPDKIDTIFDGYSTTSGKSSDSSKGMGIGLSICKTIILAHNGSVYANNHGNGAVFTFTLPYLGDDDYGTKI